MKPILSAEQRRAAYRILAALFWLAVWQALAMAVGQEFLFASPLKVLHSLLRLLSDPAAYLTALLSAGRIMLGFLLGAAFGILLAALSSRFALVFHLASPLVAMARAVPVASFAILAVILVSSRFLSTLIAMVIGFPVLYANVLEGIRQSDRKLREMAAVFQVPFFRRLVSLHLPHLAPYLRTGFAAAVGLCFKSGVAAEVIGLPRGTIGERLYFAKVNFFTADLFAWTVIIVLLSIVCAWGVLKLTDLCFSRLAKI